jgi:cold shock protein
LPFGFVIHAPGATLGCGFPRLGEQSMLKGTVKWFNETKGYGFIKPDGGGADVFIHISALQRSGLRTLPENQRVTYEIAVDPKRGKSSAVNIRMEE